MLRNIAEVFGAEAATWAEASFGVCDATNASMILFRCVSVRS
jgi:hypothetical protein